MRCITSARYTMVATVIRQGEYGTPRTSGSYQNRQNPVTFEIERVWVPVVDNPNTSVVENGDFPCIARGIVDGGIRVAGTTERITPSGVIESADYVRMQFGPGVNISKRDRVYNIRDKQGKVLWKEEEHDGGPTVFEVLGVTPIFDPFNRMVEQHALLQRAEIQSYGQQD